MHHSGGSNRTSQIRFNLFSAQMPVCHESKTRSDLQERGEATKARNDIRLTCNCDLECEKHRACRLARWENASQEIQSGRRFADAAPATLGRATRNTRWCRVGAIPIRQIFLERFWCEWVEELLHLDHGINPPEKLPETPSHTLNIQDADLVSACAPLSQACKFFLGRKLRYNLTTGTIPPQISTLTELVQLYT